VRFSSKKFQFLRHLFLWLSGNPLGWPFDRRCEELRDGVASARDPQDAYKILKEFVEIKKVRCLKGKGLYETCSISDDFFKIIESRLKIK
jgi:hypothetical protein